MSCRLILYYRNSKIYYILLYCTVPGTVQDVQFETQILNNLFPVHTVHVLRTGKSTTKYNTEYICKNDP